MHDSVASQIPTRQHLTCQPRFAAGHYELPLGRYACRRGAPRTRSCGQTLRCSFEHPRATRSGMTTAMPGPPPNLHRLAALIAVGVLQLPTPMVHAHLLQGPRRRPAQRILCKGRIGIADGDITGPALPDFIGDRSPARRFKRAHDVQNATAVARSEIDRDQTGLPELAQGTQMPGCEIDHMNEVADSGTIWRVIVVSPDLQLLP